MTEQVRVIHTDDLFLAAFALTRGGELAGVEVTGVNGRRIALFRIEGASGDVQREYYQGPAALVHLQLLKAAVRRLKDEGFAAIRQEERDASSPDQPRADRGHQDPRGLRRAGR